MAATATATNVNLWGILCESKRIINAHSRHFLALSVIFLLPLSFSLIVSPFLIPLLSPNHSSHNIHILLRFNQLQPHPTQTPFSLSLPLLLFSLSLLLLSLFSLSSITHSTFHAFFGRPVKLFSALFSTLTSFTPLLATTILSHFILLSFLIPLPHLHRLPFPFFLPTTALLLFSLLYLRITWTLAPVLTVIESTWGLHPLRRSSSLLTGLKPLAASSFLFFASLKALLLWSASVLVVGSDGWAWKDWAFVVQIVLTSTLLMLLMLYHAAADTVLYMYCKALHGELAFEIAEEFAWQ